jgi:hypothetical protein
MTVLLHKLCLDTFHHGQFNSCLEASVREVSFPIQPADLKDSLPAKAIDERHEAWSTDVPKDETTLWHWLDTLDDATRANLLAHCVSFGVNALHEKADRYGGGGVSVHGVQRRLAQADRLAHAIGLEPAGCPSPCARPMKWMPHRKAKRCPPSFPAMMKTAKEVRRRRKSPTNWQPSDQRGRGGNAVPATIYQPAAWPSRRAVSFKEYTTMTNATNTPLTVDDANSDWETKQAALERLYAELKPRNKTVLFDALAAAGVTHVVVSFDGYGDSSQIESIEAKAGDNIVNLPESKSKFTAPIGA